MLSFKDIYNENIAYNKLGYLAFRVDKDLISEIKNNYKIG